MATHITMPKLGLTMTEGTVQEWKKSEGDPVQKGDIILVVATDKLTYEVEAPEDGILARVLVQQGESVPVSADLAILTAPGEELKEAVKAEPAPQQEKEAPRNVPQKQSAESGKTVEAASSGELQKDVVVIGAGPGGYVAAIRAAQSGAKVAIIERKDFGGTCLNVGCIPTKVLLHTVELYNAVKESSSIGLMADNVKVHWPTLMKRKGQVVSQLVGGVRTLLSSNGVEMIHGEASFLDSNTISVRSTSGDKVVKASSFIIATGSEPVVPPIPGIDIPGVITSNEALSLEEIPTSMTIIGGGVIGVEFASIFSSLGCDVTIVEMLSEILPNTDEEITAILKGILQAKGVKFHTSSKVTSLSQNKDGVQTKVESASGTLELDSEKVLLSVGRKPVTEGLGLEKLGMKMNRSRIVVDGEMRTSVENIYAIGDCCSPVMLAHVASREGEVAADNIMGKHEKMDYKTNPGAIYTSPEIGWVGLTEKQARDKGLQVKIGKFPLVANGKSLIMGETEGMIKFVVDGKYDEIVGVHIIGPRATDLIVEGALALRLEATIDEIVSTIHAHPTVGEALGEAALDVFGKAIHIPPRKN